MRVLVTGASGFIGRPLVFELVKAGYDVAVVRREVGWHFPLAVRDVHVDNISSTTNWGSVLQGVDTVVHLAAKSHFVPNHGRLEDYRQINSLATINLAHHAAAAGVRRFIFLSSIKVLGEFTTSDKKFRSDDRPFPVGPYAVSKLEAELALRNLAEMTGLEVSVIRPPMVIGPCAKGNFRGLAKLLSLGVPLPLAGITENHRSFLVLDNLIDLIMLCIRHPNAANRIFLACNQESISTTELIIRLGLAIKRPAKLFYIPPVIFAATAKALNHYSIYQKLYGSLQIDATETHELLGWDPAISLDQGLKRVTQEYRT